MVCFRSNQFLSRSHGSSGLLCVGILSPRIGDVYVPEPAARRPPLQRDGFLHALKTQSWLLLLVLSARAWEACPCGWSLHQSRCPILMKPESSLHKRRNQILILVVVLSNVIGNVALGHGMHQTGAIVSASPLDYVRAFARPWTVIGVAVLAGWMISNLALLSRADLSFVLPVTASGYVLIALAGHFWLGERISAVRWMAVAAIALGVILAEETPSRTTNGGREPALQGESFNHERDPAEVHPELDS